MTMIAYVYRNLKFKGKPVYSVKDTTLGKVVEHVESITLEGVTFKVGQGGRARVLRERQKNVHAGAQGIRTDKKVTGELIRISYDPYRWDSFMRLDTMKPIKSAEYVVINSTGVFAKGVR
jgi:hypothetical protein